MTYLLDLPREDYEEMVHIVEKELAAARVETRHTFSHEFREMIQQRIKVLEHIQTILNEAPAATRTQLD